MFKTNEYFDGQVVSIAFQTETLPATVGVMAPGDYQFNTAARETVTVVSGALNIRQPGAKTWTRYHPGESFEVAADSAFDVQVATDSAYLCLYG